MTRWHGMCGAWILATLPASLPPLRPTAWSRMSGKRWDQAAGGVRGFATHFLTRPNRRGGQHHVQHLFVEKAAGGGYCVTSYWVSIKWDTAGDNKSIRTMGSYADTCVKVDGKWLIKDKIIDPWNSDTAPIVETPA